MRKVLIVIILVFILFSFAINDALAQAPQQEMSKPTPPQETSCELHSPDIDGWAAVNQWDDLVLKAIDEVAKVSEVAGTRVPGDRIKAHMMIESGGDPEAFQDKPGESGDAYGLMQYTDNAASYSLLTQSQIAALHRFDSYASIYAGTLELAYRFVTNDCNLGWDGASYGYFGGDPCGKGATDLDTGFDPSAYQNTLQKNLGILEKSECSEEVSDRTFNPTQTPMSITPTPFVCLGSPCLTGIVTPTLPPCEEDGALAPSPSQPSQPSGDLASQLGEYFAELRRALDAFFSEFRNNMQEFSNSLQNRPPGSPVVPPEIPELNLPTFNSVHQPGQQNTPLPPAAPTPCASEETPDEIDATPVPTDHLPQEEKPVPSKTDKPLPTPTRRFEQSTQQTPTPTPSGSGKTGQPLPSQNVQEIKQRLCSEYKVCPTLSTASDPGGDWTLDALTALWNVTQRMYESPSYVNHAIGHGTLEVARANTSPNDEGWAFGVYLDRDYPVYSTIPGSRLINITDRAFASNPSIGYWEWLLAHEIAHSAGAGKPDGNQISNPPSNQTQQNVILCSDVVSQHGTPPATNKQKLVSDDENYADSVSFYMTSGEEIVSGYYGGAKNLKTDHPCIYNALKEGYFEGREF